MEHLPKKEEVQSHKISNPFLIPFKTDNFSKSPD